MGLGIKIRPWIDTSTYNTYNIYNVQYQYTLYFSINYNYVQELFLTTCTSNYKKITMKLLFDCIIILVIFL